MGSGHSRSRRMSLSLGISMNVYPCLNDGMFRNSNVILSMGFVIDLNISRRLKSNRNISLKPLLRVSLKAMEYLRHKLNNFFVVSSTSMFTAATSVSRVVTRTVARTWPRQCCLQSSLVAEVVRVRALGHSARSGSSPCADEGLHLVRWCPKAPRRQAVRKERTYGAEPTAIPLQH